MEETVEVQIGPLFFTKESGSGMTVNTEHEAVGYCEGIWDDVWADFVKAARQGNIKELA